MPEMRSLVLAGSRFQKSIFPVRVEPVRCAALRRIRIQMKTFLFSYGFKSVLY